jgi:aryl-alcohol dehydrogenase-like predicted oxidoreductase
MEYRTFARTDWKISSVSFGCWAIGGSWGTVDDKESNPMFINPGKLTGFLYAE